MQAYDMLRNSNGQGFTSNDGSKVIKSVDDLKQLAKELGGCDDEALKFLDTCEKIPETIKEGETASEAFARTYGSGIKNLGSSIAKLGKTILSSLGKAALSAGITWLATTGIELVAKGVGWLWDEVLTDNAERERRTQAVTSTSENIKTYQQNTEVVDDAIKKYEELNKKINETNITFEEEVGYRKELNELQKSLNEKFGTAAEGLDLVNKGYEGQIKALKELRKEQARSFLYDSKTGALTSKDGSTDFQRNLDVINAKVGGQYNHTDLGITYGSVNELMGFDVVKMLEKHPEFTLYNTDPSNTSSNHFYVKIDPEMTQKEADEFLTKFYEELDRDYGDNPAVQEFKKKLQESLNLGYDSSQYYTAVENSKQTIRNILAYNSDDGEDILTKLENATNAYNAALARYEKDNTAKNKEELDEAKKNLDEISNTAETILTDSNSYDHRLISSTTGGLDVYGQMVNEIKDKKSDGVNGRIFEMFDGRLEMFGKLRNELDKMTDEEKLALEVELDGNSEIVTLDNLDKFINQAKENAAKNPIDLEVGIKASDAVDSMADIKTAVASLGDLYGQVVKLPADATADAKSAFGFADPATLNSIESAFGKFASTLNEEDKEELSHALSEFEDTLVRFPGDEKQAQEAINNLVTAYIDQTDAVKNLTEENKEWSIAQLKAMGITNAEEVVMTRLNKKNKQMLAGMSKLSDAFEQYGDVLRSGVKNANGYDEGIEAIQSTLHEMFSIKNDLGEELFPIDFDAQFIVDNMHLIEQAAEGDTDALNKLRHAAMDKIVATIEIDSDTEYELNGIRNEINSWIDNIDFDSLEIGAEFNDKQMIQGLNNLVKAGKITQESMNKILAGIGVVPKIEYEEVKFNASNWADYVKSTGVSGSAAAEAYKGMKQIGTISIPKISYVVGSDVAKANYSAPSSSSSNSGGGSSSGSSNKLSEDAKETYDWIEVKLKRLEEAYSRLNATASATYEDWQKRNDAINDGLGITLEQIEADEKAYKRYLKERNSFTVDAPNKSDYEDNTEQYEYDLKKYNEFLKMRDDLKRKVENGQIGSSDDIQYLANKYAKEYVDGITQWNDKAISAYDDIRAKRDQYFDGYKALFDNTQTQYENMIDEFERAFNVIDDRIKRTEAHGYFVSEKYYQQQMQLLEKERDKKLAEAEDLRERLDNAIAAGAIAKTSQEYYEWNKAIEECVANAEGLTTQMVELNKTINDLELEKFEWMMDQIDRVNDEAEFLVDLLDNQLMIDDNGRFNERGWSAVGLHGVEANMYMRNAEEYGKKVREIEAQLVQDPHNKDLIEEYEKFVDLQQESIKNYQAQNEAIKDLVSEAITKHLEALQKVIDKYKEAMSDARDLYSYSKNIKQQTDNISALQKQLQVYSGDDSEENRARLQQLQKQLREAEEGLQETEWDRYISETNKMLDDFYEDYSDTLNERLDDIDKLIIDVTEEINQRGGMINNTIQQVADRYGYQITDETNTVLSGEESLLSTYDNGAWSNYRTKTLAAYETISGYLKDIVSGETGKKVTDSENLASTQGGKWHQTKNGQWWYKYDDGTYAKSETVVINGKQYTFDKNGYLVMGGLSMNAYAKGSSGITSNQLAWTQENGSEVIFRKSDGAMLTPLNRGDMVFTNEMSKNLWAMAKNPSLSGTTTLLPDSAIVGRTVNNDNEITIVLPNVQNYNDFKNALQKDPKFVNFVQATTLGQSLGKGKLNRGNF